MNRVGFPDKAVRRPRPASGDSDDFRVTATVKPEAAKQAVPDNTFLFPHKNALFPDNRFSTHFFAMKMAELGKNVLVSCFIDLDDIQL